MTPTTVRDFQSIGYTLVPHCSHHFVCSHFKILPVTYLAEHLGWDFDVYAGNAEIRRRLVCSRCGWNWPVVTIATGQDRDTQVMASHAHAPPTSIADATATELTRREEWRALPGGTSLDASGYRRRRR